jgi:hypothetical protein
MNGAFLDYYRCPERFATFAFSGGLSEDSGYFRFGLDTICYGRSCSGRRATSLTDELHDVMQEIKADGSTLRIPFSPSEVVANLRYERYTSSSNSGGKQLSAAPGLRKAYYKVRPILPLSVRKHFQRICLRDWEEIPFPHWPVDPSVELVFENLLALLLKLHGVNEIPFIWFWPDGLPSCAIMTHDVEGLPGWEFCSALMDLDEAYGIKASFQLVPEGRYPVSADFLGNIRDRGFEINVHDLNHDGLLFSDRELFLQRAERINRYAKELAAVGFRSAVLYRNLDWLEALDFSYDMSVPNVGHLEGQRGGCCSIMPFFIGKTLELPLTTTQDYSLFYILSQYSTDLWKRQVTLITEKNGLVSFIVHPDYLRETRAQDTYKALMSYLVALRSEEKIWMALPSEVNQWWRQRSQMRLIRHVNRWEIEGPGKERARIAHARLEGNRVVYRLDSPSPTGLADRPQPPYCCVLSDGCDRRKQGTSLEKPFRPMSRA